MDKNIKLKLNTDEMKKIHQEELDIIEKDCLQMGIVLKDLEKDPDAFTITQIITFLERERKITEKLIGMVEALLQQDN